MKTPKELVKALIDLKNTIKSYEDGLISLDTVILYMSIAYSRIEKFYIEKNKPTEEETEEEAPF